MIGCNDDIVIFRVWNKNPKTVIALWPNVSVGLGLINSYEHIGQHGAASPSIMVSRTRPAKYSEYKDLLAELKQIGYRPTIRKRISRKVS